ncbi:glutamine synthetase [Clostridia bacterium]|nr:glutamine synthetase [Clostridia bacterium]GHU57498.1 glutamine synthetase [Clostridia bacterium]
MSNNTCVCNCDCDCGTGGPANTAKIFGSKVFNLATMRERLPKPIYKALTATIDGNKELDIQTANAVAHAMKEWALELGATHFTHWFQPMTGITAEKHDSFINPQNDGTVIMEFSGKELIKGEPDASSFPSGGLRSTFEARGYTAWDPTSPAFVKDDTLYLPTAFCSYSGEALDKKTPLLRSMEAVNKQALRVLRLFGNTSTQKVVATVGAEQEYFLVDSEVFDKRKDLIYTGRTLFGAPAPKGQELEDHYFGSIKQRVSDFMKDFDNALWELGITSKTKHNEVAPAQHENAPIFTTANIAADHNQLTMEILQKVAKKHGMNCLLHEKPFAGVNGSGKHDNWALSTDDGQNLLEPGQSPLQNAQFLTFLAAIVSAVDDNADLLRLSVATAGNDHRLGANEAPPAVISVFLGEELTEVIEALIDGHTVEDRHTSFNIGITSLPKFPKDTTDRNRTSPFAFTGNKFEFRMLGSSLNISGPNIILNAIVADSLSKFADTLENVPQNEFPVKLNELLVNAFKSHKRVIFNGNGYGESWLPEAESRGLPNFKTAADAIPHFSDEKNIKLLTKLGIFSEVEIHSRTDIMLDAYVKALAIEANTALDMAKREIFPSVMQYEAEVCGVVAAKEAIGIDTETELAHAKELSALTKQLKAGIVKLEQEATAAAAITEIKAQAKAYQANVFAAMQELRETADTLEAITDAGFWPLPTYGELLFSVK